MSDIVSRKELLDFCNERYAINDGSTDVEVGWRQAMSFMIQQLTSGAFPSTESEGETRDSNMEYLRRRNDSLTKRISAYRDENERILAEIERLRTALAMRYEDEEERVRFKMDATGNLTRIDD